MCCAVLCCAVLCCAVLCCAVLCCAVLCCDCTCTMSTSSSMNLQARGWGLWLGQPGQALRACFCASGPTGRCCKAHAGRLPGLEAARAGGGPRLKAQRCPSGNVSVGPGDLMERVVLAVGLHGLQGWVRAGEWVGVGVPSYLSCGCGEGMQVPGGTCLLLLQKILPQAANGCHLLTSRSTGSKSKSTPAAASAMRMGSARPGRSGGRRPCCSSRQRPAAAGGGGGGGAALPQPRLGPAPQPLRALDGKVNDLGLGRGHAWRSREQLRVRCWGCFSSLAPSDALMAG